MNLRQAARLTRDKILNPGALAPFQPDSPVLVLLAAGRGTRFGDSPKCVQPVQGKPLARHSIDAFRGMGPAPVICLVGHKHEEVSAALGADCVHILTDNPTAGTAFAALEAFCADGLVEPNPLVVISMGDRIVPATTFRRLREIHMSGAREADVTFLSAVYEPPRNEGKGRVLRRDDGSVARIIEERDILANPDSTVRRSMLSLTEGNCPLYAVRAATLFRYLGEVTNDNAQNQFYLTDIVEAVSRDGGEIRTVTVSIADADYEVLCADVTRPGDIALVEAALGGATHHAARVIAGGRTAEQVLAIARQIQHVVQTASIEELGFDDDRPIAVGISGGRLRIAFMHPDMSRFFGPAWQMPIGSGSADTDDQIVVLIQAASDGRIHLFPIDPAYRERVNQIPSDTDGVYPGEHIDGLHAYEEFGTQMSENLLLSLGYFTTEEIDRRRERGLPLPPASLWAGNSMRRPFALVMNALASMRTLRGGYLGRRVQDHIGRDSFRGLKIVSTGNIPRGGFSSSSAVVVAVQNAINSMWDLGIPPDTLVHIACQAEYGTGVRAGSLDQATEQKGKLAQGTLMSSNPRENYRVIATYPVPSDRYQILFPYTVDRDREAWRWSWGFYAESTGGPRLTTSEYRKMTGKAAEIAAHYIGLPEDSDFFQKIEDDLVSDGELTVENRRWIADVLRSLPVAATREHLMERVANPALFAGWRDPEGGVPLRAMLAYLFGEVAKNFYLIHHQDRWIEYVSLSQVGDRCFDINPALMPSREEMESVDGLERIETWLERYAAAPFDINRGLDDASLGAAEPPEFHRLRGSNFFRGLALIDLAEAMLKRAFGADAVAVRVNAAGQGDYVQIHVDKRQAHVEDVKRFVSSAIYRRFGLKPVPEFVEVHPGGGATGVRLGRYGQVGELVRNLRELALG